MVLYVARPFGCRPCALCSLFLLLVASFGVQAGLDGLGHELEHGHGNDAFIERPVEYIENLGQWDEDVLFRASIPGGALFVCRDRLVFNAMDPMALGKAHDALHHGANREEIRLSGHAFALHFGQEAERIEALGRTKLQRAYFLGDRHASRVGAYVEVVLHNVFPGVDMVLATHQGMPKYDLVVAPGTALSSIQFAFQGLDGLALDGSDLVLKTSIGDFREFIPLSTQLGESVGIGYRMIDQRAFGFSGAYDPSLPLLIDPVLLGSSYSGSVGPDHYGWSSAFDEAGNIYGGGESFGVGFPTSLGAYDTTFAGSVDIAISKFSPDASSVLYATYIGGTGFELPHSMIVDPLTDELIVLGTTSSGNYPTTTGAFSEVYSDSSFGSRDIVLTRLSPDGMALMASTYIGGSGTDGVNNSTALSPNWNDTGRGEINLDASGNIYVASMTASDDFPTTAGAFQPTPPPGVQDGVLFSFTPDLSSLIFSTYLGGSNDDLVASLKVLSTGQVVAVGGTKSSNFPTTAGVLGPSDFGGATDAFAVLLSADGGTLLQSTYLGAGGKEIAWFVDIDESDHIYVAGNCGSGLMPVIGPVFSVPASTQFVVKLEDDFSNYEWSTLVGSGSGSGSMELAPTAFLVDECGNLYLGGFTNKAMPITPDAYQVVVAGPGYSDDFYFVVLGPEASSLRYGTYLGSDGDDHVDGGTARFSKDGVVYGASCTSSGAFPTTPGAAYNTWGVSNYDRVAFKFDFELIGVHASAATASGENSGCVPFEVDFVNTSVGGSSYAWSFGDGTGSTAFEPSHTFSDTGTYVVALIARNDTLDCGPTADTAYISITVFDDSLDALFDATAFCEDLLVDFSNLSALFPSTTWIWNFGDGATSTSDLDPSHTYAAPGTYTVELSLSDMLTCNAADTHQLDVTLLPSLLGGFGHEDAGCPPLTVNFNNDNAAPVLFDWDFGNGSSSMDAEPSTTYSIPGTYTITLISSDASSCNLADTLSSTLSVHPEPLSDWNVETPLPDVFGPVDFTDLSTGATLWLWDFGDGSSSDMANPSHTYSSPGLYTVCLNVANGFGCTDVLCSDVDVDANSTLGIPNAFSPNGDGHNDVFLPIVEGMARYRFQIFNRWGALVFETSNPNQGWDGRFKGKDQELGTYVFALTATGLDGKPYAKQGHLLLVR